MIALGEHQRTVAEKFSSQNEIEKAPLFFIGTILRYFKAAADTLQDKKCSVANQAHPQLNKKSF